MIDSTKYQPLTQAGLSPAIIYQTLKADSLDRITCIKILRQLLDISVVEARELMASVDQNENLNTRQVALISNDIQILAQDQREAAFRIIEHLKRIRVRPVIYIGDEIQALRNYLNGLYTGFTLSWGMSEEREDNYKIARQSVLLSRGWKESSWHVVSMMSAYGYSYEAIVNETITIEIEAWKWAYGFPSSL